MNKLSLEEISKQRLSTNEMAGVNRLPFYVMLDNIRSLYNVGSIFRTADAVRLEKIFLTGITGHPPRKEINKTALGASETVPWEYHSDGIEMVRKLKLEGIPIVILEHTDNTFDYRKYKYKYPSCLILGNEVFGVREELLDLADNAIEIPMFGTKHSLNVSVAFGVVIYEVLYQYLKKGSFDHKPQ